MHKRHDKQRGFTIVELLIVIVVIAILAAITIVAFRGVQSRSRDSARSATVAQIQKALEAYYSTYGVYPASSPGSGTNVPSGFVGVWGSGGAYSYSIDTAGNWMIRLTQTPDGAAPIVSRVPVDPTNDNTHYLTYWSTTTGVGACQQAFYILGVSGYESSSNIPAGSHSVNCTQGATIANWVTSSSRAVFSNITGQ